ncbi:MAG: 2-amino-4-hydroxy-6-hydroxymethyldihydropteridine diphosphokinase [Bdellovibrionales bacterium]|nr:2-amino-4-hydroxy-6-hydroxymethyldihydropteridine diphosphokinase [Bdellovibrionales bacterium]
MATQSIISVKTYNIEGIEILREVFKKLSQRFQDVKSSSIYIVKMTEQPKAVHNITQNDNFEGLATVLAFICTCTANELSSYLKDLQKQVDRERKSQLKLKILTFGNEVRMTPQLNLPHPDFHTLPEELVPAAEVMPQAIHPVLKRSLFDLSKDLKSVSWGQFYAQGKTLLDKGQ